MHYEKKDQLHSLSISENSDLEKCGYFNTGKPLFQKNLRKSKFSWAPNTSETFTAALFSQFSINLGQSELEKISLSQIQTLRTVWEHFDCRSHVFPSSMREIPATLSNAIISIVENIFENF